MRRKVCALHAGHGARHLFVATTYLGPRLLGECCAPQPCPDCGAPLDLVTDGLVGSVTAPPFYVRGHELPTVMHPAPFLACSGCEYCVEVRTR